MKNSVQKITEQAKTRDTQGRFKVALADVSDLTATELIVLLSKVQRSFSQDNKDKTTQVMLIDADKEIISIDFRLKVVRPIGNIERWYTVIDKSNNDNTAIEEVNDNDK